MMVATWGMAPVAWLGVSAPESHAAGSISGTVTFSGAAPANPKMPVAKNADYCGKEMEIPVLVVNPKSKGVQWTVVYLEQARRWHILKRTVRTTRNRSSRTTTPAP